LDRPNVLIKVPATREGLPAIRQLIGEGVNVNVTLLFGLPRYREVAEAYIAGLEDRAAGGLSVDGLASVASFFLSRIDVLIDPFLERIMATESLDTAIADSLHGQIAIASAKLAYQMYKEIFHNERFRQLAALGARPQRVLWASTSTKNPAYSDVKYVEPLIGADTINTLPPETIDAYRDHGNPALRLEKRLEEAPHSSAAPARIDLDQVTQQLEMKVSKSSINHTTPDGHSDREMPSGVRGRCAGAARGAAARARHPRPPSDTPKSVTDLVVLRALRVFRGERNFMANQGCDLGLIGVGSWVATWC
jgi:transaldolase